MKIYMINDIQYFYIQYFYFEQIYYAQEGIWGKNTSQEKIKFPWWQGAYYFNMSLDQLGK